MAAAKKPTPAQQVLLDRVLEDGELRVTGKYFRSIEALERMGLVKVERGSMYPAEIKFRGPIQHTTFKAFWIVTPA